MTTKYPGQIDNNLSLPPAIDNNTPVKANAVNQLRDAIIAIESELSTKPSGLFSSVRSRLDNSDNIINNLQLISLNGDLGGTLTDPLVIGLQGRPVSNSNPSTGNVLTWNGIAWIPFPSQGGGGGGFIASGDLSGSSIDQTVIGLQTIPVSNIAPSDGYLLTYSLSSNKWIPKPAPVSAPFTASGDLSGDNTSQTVIGIQGNSIVSGAVSNGQFLVANSTPEWQPTSITGDIQSSLGVAGLLRVTAIRGFSVLSQPPNPGQSLVYNGSSYVPEFLSGDASGSLTANTVTAIQNIPVSSTPPSPGQTLEYNGTSYVPTIIPVGWTTALDFDFTAQGNQTFATDTTYSFGGFTWKKINSSSDATALQNVASNGLVVTPISSTEYNSGSLTSPIFSLTLSQIIPAFDPSMRVRLWGFISVQNAAANFDNSIFGMDTGLISPGAGPALGGVLQRGIGGSTAPGITGILEAVTTISDPFDALTLGATNNAIMLDYVWGVGLPCFQAYYGQYSGAWPSLTSGLTNLHGATAELPSFSTNLFTRAQMQVVFGAKRSGSGTSGYSVTFSRFRVDYKV